MVLIETANLSKKYRIYKKEAGLRGSIKSLIQREYFDKEALSGVSIEVRAGEIIGLLGANGAGKTTLLKILSGIIKPSGGEAKVLGYSPWKRNNQLRRQISLVMGQKAQLWWDLPAADCFLLLKEIYGIEENIYRRSLDNLVRKLDVQHLLNIQIRQLSLGERMKMELIAALLHSPKVLYLDEPTIGLDVTSQRMIREFLKDYIEDHQPAVILTSHYMEDILQLCKRVIIIRDGVKIYDGLISKLLSEYSPNKIITIKFSDSEADKVELVKSLEIYGKLVLEDGLRFQIMVSKEKVTSFVTHFFSNYDIGDLTVEELDAAIVFESILTQPKPKKSETFNIC